MYLNDSPHLANLSVFSAKPIASQLSFLLPVVYGASQVALVVKNLPVHAGDIRDMGSIPGSGRSMEEGMATHSSIPAWRMPWAEEPGGLQSMGSRRGRHD